MDHVILLELKRVVERAVRPVRATLGRKRQMREELLAHLAAIFEEEADRLGDEQAALRQAQQRFGDPMELAGQLQQAVPRWDRRRAIFENMGCQPGESAWHLAGKHFLTVLLICAIWTPIWLLLHGNAEIPGPPESQRLYVMVLIGCVPLMALFNVFFSVLVAPLLDKIGPRLASKRRGRVLLAGLSVLVVFSGVVLPPYWIGTAILFALIVRQTIKQWRYDVDWV
ncbi:MAG: hypothetical protein ABFC77_11415 [Thermoguttaceae bacterium]